MGGEEQDRDERADVALGGRHTSFGPGVQLDYGIGQGSERRVRRVHEGDHTCARGSCRLRLAQQVRTSPRLGYCDEQYLGKVLRRAIERADGWSGGGRDDAELGLEDVLGKGRGVIGAAACAGHDEARRPGTQVGGEGAHRCGIELDLASDRLAALRGLAEHQRIFGFQSQRARSGHDFERSPIHHAARRRNRTHRPDRASVCIRLHAHRRETLAARSSGRRCLVGRTTGGSARHRR